MLQKDLGEEKLHQESKPVILFDSASYRLRRRLSMAKIEVTICGACVELDVFHIPQEEQKQAKNSP